MLPIVEKIQNDTLILQDYFLSQGQMNGLVQAMIKLNKPELRMVFLADCNVDDEMNASLLEVLATQKHI